MDAIQEKLNKIREQQRRAAKAYYERKYVIKDTMTETEKQVIQTRINERNEISKGKYAVNKEYYKANVKKCIAKKKAELNLEQMVESS